MSLKSIIVDTKEVTAEFPGIPGFKVKVGAISRELLRKIRKDSTETVINTKHRVPIEKLDEDKFAALFVRAAVKGWEGLTYTGLSNLTLIDESQIEDMSEEIPYTEEDAALLLKESQVFDTWINEVVYDIARFRPGK